MMQRGGGERNEERDEKERNVKDIGDWIGGESKIEFSSTKVQRFISFYINLTQKSFRYFSVTRCWMDEIKY